MGFPKTVRLVEVGPRDGLQGESQTIPLAAKLQLIDDLTRAGHSYIEAGSFVNPKWVPQMADSEQVFSRIERRPGVRYCALTPNPQGFERALAVGADATRSAAVGSYASLVVVVDPPWGKYHPRWEFQNIFIQNAHGKLATMPGGFMPLAPSVKPQQPSSLP